MAVHQRTFTGTSAEQSIQRQIRHLAENVPQRDIDRGNRRHRHRSAAPVRAAIEKLPDVFDTPGIATDETRYHVVLQIRGHRELPAIQGCVANTRNAGTRDDLQRHEIATRAGHYQFSGNNRAVIRRSRDRTTGVHGALLRMRP
jgi:hypothetical protein